MAALAAGGRRCLAPDLYGLGDSDADAPTTFEDVLEAFTAFMDELASRPRRARRPRLGRVRRPRLGLRSPRAGRGAGDQRRRLLQRRQVARAWPRRFAADDGEADRRGDRPRGLRGAARLVRRRLRRGGRRGLLGAFEDDGRGQRATLGFYRSMDFEKLEPWQGKLAEIGAPALILWGADDPFAPLAGAPAPAARDPGLEARRARGRRPLRLRRGASSAASRRSRSFLAGPLRRCGWSIHGRRPRA